MPEQPTYEQLFHQLNEANQKISLLLRLVNGNPDEGNAGIRKRLEAVEEALKTEREEKLATQLQIRGALRLMKLAGITGVGGVVTFIIMAVRFFLGMP